MLSFHNITRRTAHYEKNVLSYTVFIVIRTKNACNGAQVPPDSSSTKLEPKVGHETRLSDWVLTQHVYATLLWAELCKVRPIFRASAQII